MDNFHNQKSVSKNWYTFQEVQLMFNYKPTQMSALAKKLKVAKVGNRKFIEAQSLENFLRQHVL